MQFVSTDSQIAQDYYEPIHTTCLSSAAAGTFSIKALMCRQNQAVKSKQTSPMKNIPNSAVVHRNTPVSRGRINSKCVTEVTG